MSISGLFDIGVSAMQTTTQLLNLTSNNIANQNTAGYMEEQASVQSIPSATITSTGASGSGVQVTDIQRLYSSFLNSQLNTENSNLSYWNNYQTGISEVQDVFNEASTSGISPAITQYFADWQNVAQNPSDDTERTTLIQDAGALTSRLNTAATALVNEQSQLLSNSQSLATQVNTDTAQIADLNKMIASNPGALDLEDQRDTLVTNLNSIIKVSTFSDNGGNLTVMVGGVPLVEGVNSYHLSANADTADNMHFYVALGTGAPGSAENPDITSSVTGGQLKANADLRDTEIPSYLNQLNAFAIDLAATTNYYQKQGYGLDGSQGGNLFTQLSTQAKYTSEDSSAGVFTSPTNIFSTNGGTLSINLGDNNSTPAAVTVSAGATLSNVVDDINSQAGSLVTATAVNMGPATEFTVNNTNNTFKTTVGGVSHTFTVQAGTYTGAALANAINAAAAGINVTYNSAGSNFTITSSVGAGGATQINFTPNSGLLTNIGGLMGFNNTQQTIGTGLRGNALNDYRISIQSNPAGNLGAVSIGVVATADGAGSGLNLLANSTMLAGGPGGPGTEVSSVSVTDPTSTVANAQYSIDYVSPFAVTAGNNTIVFNDGANNYTATIAPGNYSGAGLATAVQNALNTATKAGGVTTSNTFAVDYGVTSPDEFTIKDTSGPAVTINWAGGTATPEQLGFPPATVNSSLAANGGSVSSDSLASAFVINSTNDTLGFTDNTTGGSYTAKIADGAYTAAGLAAVLNTALNSAAPQGAAPPLATTFNVDFGTTVPDKFTIGVTAGDPVQLFTGGSATPDQFGFTDTAANNLVTNMSPLEASTVVDSPYQSDSSGLYWRVQQSTDGQNWTVVSPNTLYDPSNSTTLNQSQVNLTSDTDGSYWRTLDFNGMEVRIDGSGVSGATNPNGETFDIGFDPNAASDINTLITDPNQIAAATDMFTVDSTNNSVVFSGVNGSANPITATIPQGSYTPDALAAALQTAFTTAIQNAGVTSSDAINVAFNPNTKQFTITNTSNTKDTITFSSIGGVNSKQQIFGFSNGATVAPGQSAVSDNPASVLSSANTGIPGGNTNATTIANLANGNSFAGTTPVDFYMSLVSDVGVKASSANTNQQYESNMVSELTQRQSSISGVSLDQEAANLVMYEKSYQAAAQMIQVGNTILTTLLNMVSPGSSGA